jgi:hypothetical protein
MILVKLIVSLSLMSGFADTGTEGNQWRPVSDKDPQIEFRWYQPARNSCVVQIRDLRFKRRTQLTLTVRYLPHRAARNNIATETAQIDMGASGSSEEHISSCEEVLMVALTGSLRRD